MITQLPLEEEIIQKLVMIPYRQLADNTYIATKEGIVRNQECSNYSLRPPTSGDFYCLMVMCIDYYQTTKFYPLVGSIRTLVAFTCFLIIFFLVVIKSS